MSSSFPEFPKIAHDLNNNLAIIIAQCDLLEIELQGSPTGLARLESIRATAERMVETITTCPWPGTLGRAGKLPPQSSH